jgi:hypothetical protein
VCTVRPDIAGAYRSKPDADGISLELLQRVLTSHILEGQQRFAILLRICGESSHEESATCRILFDGDGMVHSVDIERVHTGRKVYGSCVKRERNVYASRRFYFVLGYGSTGQQYYEASKNK